MTDKDTPEPPVIETGSNPEAPEMQAPMAPEAQAMSIAKPSAFNLDKFKSKRGATVANVETALEALPHHSMAAAKDFVLFHPDEEYCSDELCFVNVPIKGQKHDTLHLIDEELAMRFLPSGKIIRRALALASKPFDIFFLCHVPTQNADNSWNVSNLSAIKQAKTQWVQATSRKAEGKECYKIDFAVDPDAFPEPRWPTQSLGELILKAFDGRRIETGDHPAILRLIGAKQQLS
jgi:hypothetical protein